MRNRLNGTMWIVKVNQVRYVDGVRWVPGFPLFGAPTGGATSFMDIRWDNLEPVSLDEI